MYIPKELIFQGGMIALTVNCVNLQDVNLTHVINHYNGQRGVIRVYLKNIQSSIQMVHPANPSYETTFSRLSFFGS